MMIDDGLRVMMTLIVWPVFLLHMLAIDFK